MPSGFARPGASSKRGLKVCSFLEFAPGLYTVLMLLRIGFRVWRLFRVDARILYDVVLLLWIAGWG